MCTLYEYNQSYNIQHDVVAYIGSDTQSNNIKCILCATKYLLKHLKQILNIKKTFF